MTDFLKKNRLPTVTQAQLARCVKEVEYTKSLGVIRRHALNTAIVHYIQPTFFNQTHPVIKRSFRKKVILFPLAIDGQIVFGNDEIITNWQNPVEIEPKEESKAEPKRERIFTNPSNVTLDSAVKPKERKSRGRPKKIRDAL